MRQAKLKMVISTFALLVVGCSGPTLGQGEPVPAPLQQWRSERIALPPDFAPTMPAGEELLRFAPGMFDAQSEQFWSYVFLMRIDEPEMNADRLSELLETYYDGLLLTVGEGREEVGSNPATVQVFRLSEQNFRAEIRLIDAFVTLKEICLRVLIYRESDPNGGTLLRFEASPQAPGHPLWRSLHAAALTLEL